MKICLFSPNFFPMIGGLENVVMDLATTFSEMNHKVKVITFTVNTEQDVFPFEIIRNPSYFKAWSLIKDADVFLEFNVSLKGILLWLGTFTPLFISHQSSNPKNLIGRLKNWVANTFAQKNICCSHYIAEPYARAVVIPNPYKHDLFKVTHDTGERTKDIVFLGRLVSDKGAELLIQAIAQLSAEGIHPIVSIIGVGPELEKLKNLVQTQGLQTQITFLGQMTGLTLIEALNQHKIMAIPSLWEEPFGIVALEGIATGCIVVGSEGGGLIEAIGPCGLTFPNGEGTILKEKLKEVLMNYPFYWQKSLDLAPIHLQRHEKNTIAKAFEREMRQIG